MIIYSCFGIYIIVYRERRGDTREREEKRGKRGKVKRNMSRFASSYSRGVRMVLEHGAAVLRLPRPVEQAARKARLKRGVDVDVDQVGEKEGLEKGHESLSEVSIKPRRLSALAEARARKVFREQGWYGLLQKLLSIFCTR